MSEFEYKINEYLTLKLEDKKTFIYVQNEKFLNCIRLMLQIPKSNIEDYDEINSIDEAADIHKTLFQNTILEDSSPHSITPEQEFWGHCSNIEAWVENEYDSRLLHSNIAFPLIKKLTKAGDPIAKKVYKNEITDRFTAGYLPVSRYLINEGYLKIFNDEELEVLKEYLIAEINKLDQIWWNKQSKADLNDYGRAFNEIGEYDKATEILIKVLEIDPNYSKALNNLGVAFYYNNNYKKAKKYYSKAAKYDPYDALAWSNLSELADMEGDFEKSMELAQRALELDPDVYEALFFYAHANYKKDKYSDAIIFYKKALKLDEDRKYSYSLKDHRVLAHLGEAYYKNGNFKDALKASEKSLELCYNLPAINLRNKVKKQLKKGNS